jgi:hypothetical protein
MMGHYRSEMGYDEQDRLEAEAKRRRIDRTAAEIQKAIDEHGVAAVLADIILDTHSVIGMKYKR